MNRPAIIAQQNELFWLSQQDQGFIRPTQNKLLFIGRRAFLGDTLHQPPPATTPAPTQHNITKERSEEVISEKDTIL
jgi:hypothetical protein